MPYCNPKTNEVQELKIKFAKVTIERVEKSGPVPIPGPVLAESPATMAPDEEPPEDLYEELEESPVEIAQPKSQVPCKNPSCDGSGHGSAVPKTDVSPNKDNPFSGL